MEKEAAEVEKRNRGGKEEEGPGANGFYSPLLLPTSSSNTWRRSSSLSLSLSLALSPSSPFLLSLSGRASIFAMGSMRDPQEKRRRELGQGENVIQAEKGAGSFVLVDFHHLQSLFEKIF